MPITVELASTWTSTAGVDDTLHTVASAKVLSATVDLNALATTSTEMLQFWWQTKILSTGTSRKAYMSPLYAAMSAKSDPIKESPLICSAQSAEFHAKQTGGASRAIPFSVNSFGTVTVQASGTLAGSTSTAEISITTSTQRKTLAFGIDLNVLSTGRQAEVRIKRNVVSGGTQRVVWRQLFIGAQESPNVYTLIPNTEDMSATVVKTTTGPINWELYSVG